MDLDRADRVAAQRVEAPLERDLLGRELERLGPGAPDPLDPGVGGRRSGRGARLLERHARQAAALPAGVGVDHVGRELARLERLAQAVALELAAGGAREQLGGEAHHLLDPIGERLAQARGDLAHDLGAGAAGARQDAHERDHALQAGGRVGRADHRHPLGRHARDVGQERLEVGRVEVAPAHEQDVLEPAGHEQLALGDQAEVPGAQPAVAGERGGGRGGVVEVAAGHVGAAQLDLAHHPLGREGAGRAVRAPGADPQLDPGERRADPHERGPARVARRDLAHAGGVVEPVAVEHQLAQRGARAQRGHGHRGLGQAVRRTERLAPQAGRRERVGEPLDQGPRDRLGAVEDAAQGREVEPARRLGAQPAQGLRQPEVGRGADRGAVRVHGLEPGQRAAREPERRHEDLLGARHQRGQVVGQAHVVMQRHPAQRHILGADPELQPAGVHVGEDVGVAEHDPARRAGAARAELHQRHVVRPGRGGLRLLLASEVLERPRPPPAREAGALGGEQGRIEEHQRLAQAPRDRVEPTEVLLGATPHGQTGRRGDQAAELTGPERGHELGGARQHQQHPIAPPKPLAAQPRQQPAGAREQRRVGLAPLDPVLVDRDEPGGGPRRGHARERAREGGVGERPERLAAQERGPARARGRLGLPRPEPLGEVEQVRGRLAGALEEGRAEQQLEQRQRAQAAARAQRLGRDAGRGRQRRLHAEHSVEPLLEPQHEQLGELPALGVGQVERVEVGHVGRDVLHLLLAVGGVERGPGGLQALGLAEAGVEPDRVLLEEHGVDPEHVVVGRRRGVLLAGVEAREQRGRGREGGVQARGEGRVAGAQVRAVAGEDPHVLALLVAQQLDAAGGPEGGALRLAEAQDQALEQPERLAGGEGHGALEGALGGRREEALVDPERGQVARAEVQARGVEVAPRNVRLLVEAVAGVAPVEPNAALLQPEVRVHATPSSSASPQASQVRAYSGSSLNCISQRRAPSPGGAPPSRRASSS